MPYFLNPHQAPLQGETTAGAHDGSVFMSALCVRRSYSSETVVAAALWEGGWYNVAEVTNQPMHAPQSLPQLTYCAFC
jgi:hypothetical protein